MSRASVTPAPPTGDGPVLRIAPPPFLAEAAFAALLAALPDARVVGGAVRDALAGRPIADIDLATALAPAAVMAALGGAGIRAVPTGLAHGTVTAVLDGPGGRRGVEITTLRRDVATDGRHATVAFTDDWRQDAARRDFTINAMSMTRDGAVHDYFGGLADLRAGVVRFVGDPAQRIAEDTLRVLRYFRFFARYAATRPDPSVCAALRAGIPGLARLSAERVWSETLRILTAPDPGAAVALMAELGILAAVIPEGADPAAVARLVTVGAPVDPLLRLAALLSGDIEGFADRLRLSAAERRRLLELRAAPSARPADDDAELRRWLADHDRGALIDRTWLAQAALSQVGMSPAGLAQGENARAGDAQAGDGQAGGGQSAGAQPAGAQSAVAQSAVAQSGGGQAGGARVAAAGATDAAWAGLRARLARIPQPVFPLAGDDVLALGVAPGPGVGALLRATRAWWLAGGCAAGAGDCCAELARRMSQIGASAVEMSEKSPPS